MKTKAILLLLITVFYFSYFGTASALTIYSQELDDTGEIAQGTGFTSSVVGYFTTGSDPVSTVGITISFDTKNYAAFCGGSNAGYIDISTTSSSANVLQIFQDSFVVNDTRTNTILTGTSTVTAQLQPSTTYYVLFHSQCSGSDYRIISDVGNSLFFGYIADGGGYTPTFYDTIIYDFDPKFGSTTATTIVDFYASYFIDDDDLNESCQIFDLVYDPVTGNYTGNPGCNYKLQLSLLNLDNVNQPAYFREFSTVSGINNTESFTATLPKGFYSGSWALKYGNLTVTSTTTRFVVATTSLSSTTTDYYLGIDPDDNPIVSPLDCSGLSMLSLACIRSLFVLTGEQSSDLYDSLTINFFDKVPFAYVTRMNEIINGTTTVPLPSISYTVASTSLFMANTTIEFDPWQYGYQATSSFLHEAVSNESGDDIWEIMENIVSVIIYLSLIFIIINDLLHVHSTSRKAEKL